MVSDYCASCDNYGEWDNSEIGVTPVCHFFDKTFEELNNQRTRHEIVCDINYFDLKGCVGHTNPDKVVEESNGF